MHPPPHMACILLLIYIRVCIGQCGERERERERRVCIDGLTYVCMCVRKQVESVQAIADAFRKTIDALAKEGKLSLLIHGMLEHAGHEHVAEAACEALAGLAASDDNQRVKVAAEGGIGAIVGAMQRQPSANVQAAACRALWYLTINNDANKVRIAAEGGVGAIVSAMQHHPTNAEVQEAGCNALASLTCNNSANKAKAKSAGAEDAVKRAMALQDATAKTKEWGQRVLDNLKNV